MHQARGRRSVTRLLFASALSLGTAQAAFAQTDAAAPVPQDSDAATSTGQLQEIIVTAQRRSQNLQDTPIAVTAFSAKELEAHDTRNVRDLITATPNLQIFRVPGTDPNFVLFSIRGFNIARPTLGVQQPVGIYVDDIFYPSLSGALLRVLDLSSVEVLRGPQGTLFGRNSLGGAVRYNTIAPDTTRFSGRAEMTLGERNRRDFTASINVPINEAIAFRLSGGTLHQDGFVTDTTTGKPVGNVTNHVARLQLRVKPADNLTIDLTGEYVKANTDGDGLVVSAVTTTGPFDSPEATGTKRYNTTFVPNFYNILSPPTAPKYDSRYVGSCLYCSSGVSAPEFSETETKNVRAVIAWSPSKALTVKSLTGYFDIPNSYLLDADRSPILISQTQGTSRVRSFSQELQFSGSSGNGKINYTGGFFYFNNRQETTANNTGFGPATSSTASVRSDAYALYAQASVEMVPGLTATVGARQSWENVSVVSDGFVPPKAKFEGFTPNFKLQYRATPDIMVYASASKGFRGGTINTVDCTVYTQVPCAIASGKVDPDTAWSYELGARTEFLDRHLQLNITAFRSDYENIQLVVAYPPVCPIGVPCLPIPQTVLQNAGQQRLQGIEVEAAAVIGRLRLRGTLATLDAKYLKTGAATDITVNSYIEHAPKLTYSIGAAYTVPIGTGSLQANLDYGWQGRQVAGNQDKVSSFMAAYGVANGRIAYTINDNITVAVVASNIFDKYYVRNSANNRYYTGLAYEEPGEPRTVSATVQLKF